MKKITIQKKEIIKAGKHLLAEGLVMRTWGNVSIRLDETYMIITPSGRAYETLTEKDIILVNYHNLKYKGKIKPSSEKDLHCEIYRTRKEINAVIHTHQLNASIVAATGREIPPILDDQAQILGISVRVAKYAPSASDKITKNTVKALKNRMAALMANHGAVCIGRDLDEAFVACQILEKTSKAFIDSEILGGAKSIGKKEAKRLHHDYLENYSIQLTENKGFSLESKV